MQTKTSGLLVDDDLSIFEIVKRALSPEMLVVSAPTLAAASEALDKRSFDLILLDVMLPDGDGFKFCAAIKTGQTSGESTRPGAAADIVFVTGKGEVDDKV